MTVGQNDRPWSRAFEAQLGETVAVTCNTNGVLVEVERTDSKYVNAVLSDEQALKLAHFLLERLS